ncbi:MAG TPA: hypothetical protein DDY68_00385 [Porphyromonadaceae bacterium]|nr:hypothetical protein [Porphyromonadaceae bacterium]
MEEDKFLPLGDQLEELTKEFLALKERNSAMQKVIQKLKQEFEMIKISTHTPRYMGITNGHAWVQLWEGGPKFATCNIGANQPWEYGGRYTWGGTYAQIEGTYKDDYWKEDATFPSDRNIATISWGEEWRMPTKEELYTLLQKCGKGKWVDNYNGTRIKGRLFKGKGKFIEQELFFPATGYCNGCNFYDVGASGNYWSCVPNDCNNACFLYFNGSNSHMSNYNRNFGLSVRAVLNE